MNKTIEFVKKHYFILILVLIEIALFLVNYKPGTFLVGWDNLYPELNFSANLKRNLFAVWQEYRGLGTQDGMAHAANLLHTLFLFILSFILPLNLLRYSFIFLSHLFGGIGMYFLLWHYILKDHKRKSFIAFCGALFYLFNLNTIQMFYAPLEVFTIHFASLSWLTIAILKTLERPSKKNVFLLFTASFLSTPQGFVPTVFFSFFILALSLVLCHVMIHGFKQIGRAFLILSIILATNAFWILPFIHSGLSMGKVIKNTKINQISSEEIYEKNKARGDVFNVLTLRGFMLDVREKNIDGSQNNIMNVWNKHVSSPFVVITSLIFAVLSFIGIKNARHHKTALYFLPPLVASFFFLGNNVPILSHFNGFLRYLFPLLGEALRFPYTKFSILFIFSLSIFVAVGLGEIEKRFKTLPNLFVLILLLYALPSFQGSFLYDNLRLRIPPEYFQVINFFKQQPKNERIMTLPQTSFWNWSYYSWGARGSGFLWYGIEQPMLERSFDPWSNYNEQYVNELLYSLQSQDNHLFKNVVQKYAIEWILVDENILLQSSKPFDKDKLEAFIKTSFAISKQYDFGTLHIYKIRQSMPITLSATSPRVTSYGYETKDIAYERYGNYLSTDKNPQIAYIFPSLFTNKTQKDLAFTFDLNDKSITVTPKNSFTFDPEKKLKLSFTPYSQIESLIPAEIRLDQDGKNVVFTYLLPKIIEDERLVYDFSYTQTEKLPQNLEATSIIINGVMHNSFPISTYLFTKIPNALIFQKDKVKIPLNISIKNAPPMGEILLSPNQIQNLKLFLPLPSNNEYMTKNALETEYQIEKPCSGEPKNKGQSDTIVLNDVTLLATNSSTCLHSYIGNLYHDASYLFLLDVNTTEGLPLRFFIDNPYQKLNVVETILNSKGKQIIIVPKTESAYQGYGLHIKSVSFNNQPSRGSISTIAILPFPYEFLRDLRLEDSLFTLNGANDNKIVVLSQAFHPGWRAYQNVPGFIARTPVLRYLSPLFGQELKEHVLVNNWGNGWKISGQNSTDNRLLITVIFLPQYLEFLGFGLLLLTLGALLV